MSKFNAPQKGARTTTNLAGGKAYTIRDKEKLTKMVLTTFFKEPKFYSDTSNEIIDTLRIVIENDAKYVANLAIYAREVMHLRSVSQAIIGELANHVKGKQFVRKAMSKVVERVDDMTEIVAYQLGTFGKPIPNSMKKAIQDIFPKFSEFALAKYDRAKSVTLKDLLCLAHVKPNGTEQSDMWKRLIEGNLEIPKTWETEVSAKGNKKEVWEELVAEKKIGYMASLRNLRNMANANIDNMDQVLDFIQNPTAIANSKQLPFRYFSAYRELQDTGIGNNVINALSNAMETATKNLPVLKGRTFFAGDNSGSMNDKISERSKVSCRDISSLFMAIGDGFCEKAITSVFGERFSPVNCLSRDSIFSKMRAYNSKHVGHCTNLWTVLDYAINHEIVVDRFVIFTDEQCYDSGSTGWYSERKSAQEYFDRYLREVNSNCYMHIVNLNAQDGTTQFLGKNVNYIAGWSEKIFDLIPIFEDDTGNMIKTIEGHYFK